MMAAAVDAMRTASRMAVSRFWRYIAARRSRSVRRRSCSSMSSSSSRWRRRLSFSFSDIVAAIRSLLREEARDDLSDLAGHHVLGFAALPVPLGDPGLLVAVAVL